VAARRVLITGATGFVGANVARRMLARGHEVHALARRGRPSWRIDEIAGALAVHDGDLCDPASASAAIAAARPHWVLHLAAYGAYPSQTDVARCVRTNVEGAIRLMEACADHGVERFVNAGTSSEYGRKDHAPSEDELPEPDGPYAVTKLAATAYAAQLGRAGRLHATTLRLYSAYGPYEEPTRLVPTVIVEGMAGRLPPLVAPDVARDYVYVDDVADAFEAALHADVPGGRVYNVGTGVQTPLREVAALSRARFAIAEEPRWGTLAPRTWDTTTWIANPARAATELGWRASTTFVDGFARTAAWLSAPERRSFYQQTRTPPD
jgi:dolichol-phosphate mannosyltransferase